MDRPGWKTIHGLIRALQIELGIIATGEFQDSMMLPITRMADTNTWMSLLLSKGNPDRPAIACDTRFEMIAERTLTMQCALHENLDSKRVQSFILPPTWTQMRRKPKHIFFPTLQR